MNDENNNPIIIKTMNSKRSFFTQKQLLLNKQKELDKKLYIFTKNSLYSQQRQKTEPKKKDYLNPTLPKITTNSGDWTPHKTAFMIQREKIAKSSFNLFQQKKAKAKEIHDESSLLRMNIMIIHNKRLECNKAKRILVNDQMTIMKDSISNYRKLKKKFIELYMQSELNTLEKKNRIKIMEIQKVIQDNNNRLLNKDKLNVLFNNN